MLKLLSNKNVLLLNYVLLCKIELVGGRYIIIFYNKYF